MFNLRLLCKRVKISNLQRFSLTPHPTPLPLYFNLHKAFSSKPVGPDSVKPSKPSSLLTEITTKISAGLESLRSNQINQSIIDLINSLQEASSLTNIPKEQLGLILRAHYELGKLFENNNNLPKASAQYQQGLSLVDSQANDLIEIGLLNNSMGRISLQEKKMDEAKTYLTKAKEVFQKIGPSTVKAQFIENAYLLSVMFKDTSMIEQALVILDTTLKQNEGREAEGLDLAFVYHGVANMYLTQKNEAKASKYFQKCVNASKKVNGETSEATLNVYLSICKVLMTEKYYEPSYDYLKLALKLSQKLFGENHERTTECYLTGAMLSMFVRDPELSLQYNLKAIKFLEKEPQMYYGQLSEAYSAIILIYLEYQNLKEAETHFTKILNVSVSLFGEKSKEVAELYAFWGSEIKTKADAPEKALEACLKAYEIEKEQEKRNEERISGLCHDIGALSFQVEKFDDAMKFMKESLEFALKENSESLCDIYNVIGSIHFEQQNLNDSIHYFQLAIKKCLEKEDEPIDIDVYYKNLAFAYGTDGKPEKCLLAFERSFDYALKNRGVEDEVTQEVLHLLADELGRQYKLKEAEELLGKYQLTEVEDEEEGEGEESGEESEEEYEEESEDEEEEKPQSKENNNKLT